MGKKKKRIRQTSPVVDAMDWAEEYLSTPQFNALQKSLQLDIPVSIRINCLKSKPAIFIEKLRARYGWDTQTIPFCASGYRIRSPERNPSSTIEHRMGYFYIQEAASMLPAELFDFSGMTNPKILDMAASPGGKTIHLIDKMEDQGLVIANDASRSRIPALRIVLENWGAINQAVTCQQGEWFGYAMPETFDAVLVDAPCSMQGLQSSSSHASRPITENEIDTLAERQTNLLISALQCVKTGGQVVYSTCTLSPQENEGVLSKVMERYRQHIEIIDIQQQLPSPAPGIDHIEGTELDPDIKRAARLWPHIFNTAGFFCAKLIKIQPMEKSTTLFESNRASEIDCLLEEEVKVITRQFQDQYGFNLFEKMQALEIGIADIDGKYYLVPKRLNRLETALAPLSLGMPLGKALPSGWQPSHALVSRFGDQFTRGIFTLKNIYLEKWTRGEDIRGISDPSFASGTVVVVRDENGRNLGRGKILKDRLKNQLPTRLF